MILSIRLDKPTARFLILLTGGALCLVLGGLALQQVITGMLTDERVAVPRQWLAAGVRYAPNSAPLLARLAETEMAEGEVDMASCEARARRAANLSPWNFRYQLLLASIEEAKGERNIAEQYLRAARTLAPNYTDIHWQLANLLVRQGRVAQSLTEFRKVTMADRSVLPATFNLIWYASGRNVEALGAVTANDAPSQMTLAAFLFKQSAIAEAVKVFRAIDASARRSLPESAALIDSLIARGNVDLARELWLELRSQNLTSPTSLFWNGDFETDSASTLKQFDWAITQSDYLRTVIDATTSHSGSHSLRLDFTGRDTLRLDGEIKQLVVVRPQTRYRLEFYVKAKDFVSPEGPCLMLAHSRSREEIARSAPIAEGSYEWQRLTFEFVAPTEWGGLLLTIKRVPKFSYDEPTRGSLWLDDFTLSEVNTK